MKKLMWAIGVVSLLLATSAYANLTIGSTVQLKELGVSPGTVVTIASSGYTGGGVLAGVYNIDIQGIGQLPSFCIDLRDWSASSYQPYGVVALKDAPDPLAGPMGPAKAADLSKLLDAYWTSGLTPDQASGLQLAVWEIVDEKTDAFYNIGSGNFQAAGNGNASTYAAQYLLGFSSYNGPAGSYLALTNQTPPQEPADPLHSLGYYQDYVVRVPVPGAILLGGIGVSLVGWLRRRRTM